MKPVNTNNTSEVKPKHLEFHLKKVKALEDIWTFADIINFKGGSQAFSIIHKKLAGFITSPQTSKVCKSGKVYNNRRLVQMPRGHLKSTVCSVLYVLWRIYRNPNIRILFGTNLKELSEAFIRELRQYLEDPELQTSIWNARPHIHGRLIPQLDGMGRNSRRTKATSDTEALDRKLKWTTTAIQVIRTEKHKEPTVLATSAGTRTTGHHYDLLILDDIVDFSNTSTLPKMDALYEWAQDMESVLNQSREVTYGQVARKKYTEYVGDEVVILGTRYTKGDYYEYLEQNLKDLEYKFFKRNIYVNGLDNSNGYIWPEKFNDLVVARLKKRLTTRRWSSQYLNKVLEESERSLNRDLIKYFYTNNVSIVDNLVHINFTGEIKPRRIRPYLVIDPAISQRNTADNTSITVGGIDENLNVYILDAKIGRYTPSETTEHIFNLCNKWKLFSIYLEVNGVGAALPETIRQHFRAKKKTIVIKEFRMQGEKKTRIETCIQPLLHNSQLYLSDYLAPNEIIAAEFEAFPSVRGKDDFLDTISMLYRFAHPTVNYPNRNKLPRPRLAVNSRWGGVR
ncbi:MULTISPECIES: hypothetical protein [Calothrix]|uniref:Terminase large subunit ribonuclease H-like domain-containing protein n=2 Tax=Calothrix TaxID=1186 RepID=A0ABR8AJG1_9CYAN|nr:MULTISPECIES: hypothetical protein [Calothrix]MBD2200157.1 hypothetical protein [Calothrix parietina FACHB-288]MBD2229133.1 hypothetical protein [Calothrix anomala FACHB-343]